MAQDQTDQPIIEASPDVADHSAAHNLHDASAELQSQLQDLAARAAHDPDLANTAATAALQAKVDEIQRQMDLIEQVNGQLHHVQTDVIHNFTTYDATVDGHDVAVASAEEHGAFHGGTEQPAAHTEDSAAQAGHGSDDPSALA